MNITDHNEYDALGELFRMRLENHRIPVDGNGWKEIERRMGKRKKKAVIWLWSAGFATVAASIALLLIFNQPATDETPVWIVSQQVSIEETEIIHLETAQNSEKDNMAKNPVRDLSSVEKVEKNITITHNMQTPKETGETGETGEIGEIGENEQTEENYPVIAQSEKEIPKLDISLLEDEPEETGETGKMGKKWLFAAAFGTGGSTSGLENMSNDYSSFPEMGWDGMGSGNDYAAQRSSGIQSFSYMSREDFTNIQHRMPFSFGVTARKSLGKRGGVESGLVYTCLSSRFEWESYDVHQSLHYMGIPVNMTVYLGNSKSNWRVYLSGGFTVEKGLRAIYRQERRWGSEIRTTTVKKSSIDGLQWSLNGALGVSYKLEKGWGIYFEPRVGYSFDCSQPISVRTEMPVFFGINMGLNYEL